jgi:hypothetical protein
MIWGLFNMILESNIGKGSQNILIHKSRYSFNKIGSVFFEINGNPPKGYAT